MKTDFTIPKEITDKLEIGKWYEVRGFWDGSSPIKWSYEKKEKKK